MQRRTFIKNISILSISMNSIKDFKEWIGNKTSDIMPVLFVGHGNPMNAIEENEFSRTWREMGKVLPRPKAILCVSAHWLTKGTYVTAMTKPKTIHDFGGFPDELFAAQYPAPGSPEMATETIRQVRTVGVKEDFEWGLDHGCWSVLKPMFPQADIPAFQLSIDYSQPPSFHYELAKELKELRNKGVLIIGSGNIVHNLGMMQWNNMAYDWAIEFDNKSKELMDKGDFDSLVNYDKLGQAARLSIPTNDHYLPLLYSLALKEKNESIKYFNDKITMGSVSMRSLLIG